MINFTTPALLFPAISLLMLAYTNRFLGLANLVRTLYSSAPKHDAKTLAQIRNLSLRIKLIRQMQLFGATSILFCVLVMIAIFFHFQMLAMILFVISLLLFVMSLILSAVEIHLSVNALNILLSDLSSNSFSDSKQVQTEEPEYNV